MAPAVREPLRTLSSMMNEKLKRRWAACEALALGRGGISAVASATGMFRVTIRTGIHEVQHTFVDRAEQLRGERVRQFGAGRPPLTTQDPTLLLALKQLIDPATRGDPMSPLLWTSKSTRTLAEQLQRQGHHVSYRTVARLLQDLGLSLKANRKTREGKQHPDRDAQFEYINRQVRSFQRRGRPVISVDAKKRELLGDFKQAGQEWQPKGQPEPVRTNDFKDKDLGVGIPYGVYDQTQNNGWVSVGIDHNTAEFATATIRRWWERMGSGTYPEATEL